MNHIRSLRQGVSIIYGLTVEFGARYPITSEKSGLPGELLTYEDWHETLWGFLVVVFMHIVVAANFVPARSNPFTRWVVACNLTSKEKSCRDVVPVKKLQYNLCQGDDFTCGLLDL